jgi:hypothetical protein
LTSKEELLVKIKADLRDYERNLSRAERKAQTASRRIRDTFSRIKMAALAAGAAVTGFVATITKWAAEEEAVMRVTTSLLKAHGEAFEGMDEHIDRHMKKLEKLTAYNDTELQRAFNTLLAAGMRYTEALEAMNAVTSMAFSLNRDLVSMALLVGKAYNGQTGELSRYGIVLDENLDKTEKFNALMEYVSKNFADASERAKTLEGRLAAVNNQLHNIAEAIGAMIIPKALPYLESLAEHLERIRRVGFFKEQKERLLALAAAYTPIERLRGKFEEWYWETKRVNDELAEAKDRLAELAKLSRGLKISDTPGFAEAVRRFAESYRKSSEYAEEQLKTYQELNVLYQTSLSMAQEDGRITYEELLNLEEILSRQEDVARILEEELGIRRSLLDLVLQTKRAIEETASASERLGRALTLPAFRPYEFARELGLGMRWTAEEEREWFRMWREHRYRDRRVALTQTNNVVANISITNPPSGEDVQRRVEQGIIDALSGRGG